MEKGLIRRLVLIVFIAALVQGTVVAAFILIPPKTMVDAGAKPNSRSVANINQLGLEVPIETARHLQTEPQRSELTLLVDCKKPMTLNQRTSHPYVQIVGINCGTVASKIEVRSQTTGLNSFVFRQKNGNFITDLLSVESGENVIELNGISKTDKKTLLHLDRS